MAALSSAARLDAARRVVVKIGSALLVVGRDRAAAARLARGAGARTWPSCAARGKDVVLVSSGSIALGRRVLRPARRRAVAGAEPGRGGGRADPAGAGLRERAGAARHHHRAGAGDARGQREPPALPQLAARRSARCSTSAWCRSSTRTTRWRPTRSATATTTGWRRRSRAWPAPTCWCCCRTSTGSTPPTRAHDPARAAARAGRPRSRPRSRRWRAAPARRCRKGGMKTKLMAAQGRDRAPAAPWRSARARSTRPLTALAEGAPCTWFEPRRRPARGAQALDLGHEAARPGHGRRRRGGGAGARQVAAAGGRHRRSTAASRAATRSRSPGRTARWSARRWRATMPREARIIMGHRSDRIAELLGLSRPGRAGPPRRHGALTEGAGWT